MPNWYEAIFVTPSNHRVHHGLNKEYIDKNYGGVFIFWDRIFGTFAAERDDIEIVYGVSDQLNSWNPSGQIQRFIKIWPWTPGTPKKLAINLKRC